MEERVKSLQRNKLMQKRSKSYKTEQQKTIIYWKKSWKWNNTTKPTFKSPEVQEAPPSTERNISLVQDAIKKNVRSYETTVVNSDKTSWQK